MFILICRCSRSFSTKVESANQNPVWAGKHVFPNIAHEDIGSVQLDVTVWNFSHSAQHECIGNILIGFLMKKPQWPFFWLFWFSNANPFETDKNKQQMSRKNSVFVDPGFVKTCHDLDKRLIHLLFTEIFLYYGAQKFLYWGLTTEISVLHSTENFCEK